MEKSIDEGLLITQEEYEKIINDLESFSNYQRLSSVLIWLGIGMVILHIFADIFFHIT